MTDTTSTGTSDAKIVLTRTLGAPPELVWTMFTETEHFAAWYGPTGARLLRVEMDVTEGGRRFVAMEMDTPGGTMTMWFVGEFVTIEPPNRLVYTESLADESGRVLSAAEAGMPPGHPTVTRVIVDLAATDGGTRLRLTHEGVPAGSPGEAGWNMALDALADRIAAA